MRTLRVAACAIVALFALTSCDWFTTPKERIARAEKLFAAGSDRAAAIELQNALAKEPDNTHARLMLAQISLRIGDVGAAEQERQRAITAHAPLAETSALGAEILLARNEASKLLAALDDGSLKLDAPSVALYRGLALLANGERDTAIKSLEQTLAADANSHRARLALADAAALGGDFDGALAQIDNVLTAVPDDAQAWLAKGRLLMRRGDYKLASTALATARSHAAGALTSAQYIGLLSTIVETQIASGDPKSAHASLADLGRAAPDSPLFHLLAARIAMVEQNYAVAVTEAQRVVTAVPQLPLARLVLGSALMANGNLNQSEVQLSELVRLTPESPEALKLLAEVNLRLKRPDVAMQVLSPLQQGQGDPQADALLGWVSLQRGDEEKAIELLRRSADSQPGNASLKLELAVAYIGAGRRQEAVELLRSMPASADGAQRERLLIVAFSKGKVDDAARAEVARIVGQFPRDVGILNVAASFHAQQRDFARARELLATAHSIEPRNVGTLSNLAQVESAAGDSAAVEKALRAIVALEPAHPNARMALARIELRRNDGKAAIAELEAARAADAKSAAPRLMLASVYLRAKDTTHADAVLRELGALGEDDTATALQTGRLYADSGRYDEALGLFRAVVKREPRNLTALLETGRAQLARDDHGGARDAIQKALDLEPNAIPANAMMVGVDLKEGRSQDALARVARVRQQYPDSAMAALLDGEVNLSLRNGETAARAYAASYKLRPTAAAAIRGFRARTMAKMPDAVAPLQDWLAREPRDVGARMVFAMELQRQGKYRDAIAQYERVVTDGGPNASALNNLAGLYQDAKDARAEGVAKQAYDLAQGAPPIADTYAWILVDQGRVADAISILERVVAVPGATAEMRYHLAAARARNGQKAEARADLRRLLAGPAFPGAADARKLLAELGD